MSSAACHLAGDIDRAHVAGVCRLNVSFSAYGVRVGASWSQNVLRKVKWKSRRLR